jgi:hypothetical protein
MDIGMLWFDNDPKTEITAKIARAAAYYQRKYGKSPNLCFVHPSMLPQPSNGHPFKSGEVVVRPSPSVRPNHFWIGVDNQDNPSNDQ